jgi:hypothetical protein
MPVEFFSQTIGISCLKYQYVKYNEVKTDMEKNEWEVISLPW